jgi:predicted small secreted protein
MDKNKVLIVAGVLLSGLMAACQPQTTAEKMKDKVEDATHETGQAIERAGDKVKDATR